MTENEQEEEEPRTGALLYDSTGKMISKMSEEEYSEMMKDWDDEYMCPKSTADWKRSMGIPPLWKKKDLPQQQRRKSTPPLPAPSLHSSKPSPV